MKMLLISMGITGLTLAGHVAAQQEPDALASAAACNTCHLLKQKMVGPSYQAVAARYRSEDGAAEQVYERMREGSQGVWGRQGHAERPGAEDSRRLDSQSVASARGRDLLRVPGQGSRWFCNCGGATTEAHSAMDTTGDFSGSEQAVFK